MSRSEKLQTNCAAMMAQMLATYTRRWCMALMWVLVVIMMQTLLRFSLDPERKHPGTLSKLVSTMQENIFAVSMEMIRHS